MKATERQREWLTEHLETDGYAAQGVLTESGRELPHIRTKRVGKGSVSRLLDELTQEEASDVIQAIWQARERAGRDPDTGGAVTDPGGSAD